MAFKFLKRDADALLKQVGLCMEATWQGQKLTGVRSMLKRQDAATLAGAMYHYDFSFLVAASELSPFRRMPEPLKDSLIINGTPHIILSLDEDIAGNIRYHLGAQYG